MNSLHDTANVITTVIRDYVTLLMHEFDDSIDLVISSYHLPTVPLSVLPTRVTHP